MKIRGWSIQGFGHFRDYVVENLPEGLVVFRGPNEAGKTTLLAFLRGVLFGFSEAGPDHYPALRGGRHGGRIFVGGEDGEYAVEREGQGAGALHVLRPDGHEGTNDDLQRLLSGVDDALFRAVFAFGLPELQGFEALDAEALRDRIFSASLAGAGRSTAAAIEQLGRDAAELLGDEGRINASVEELNQLGPRRDAARRDALAYRDVTAAEHRTAAEIGVLRRRAAELQAAHRRAELLVDLWPQWSALAEARASLAALERSAPLPDGLPKRLREANEQIGAARAVSTALEQEQEEAARGRERAFDPRADERGPRIESVHQDLALQRARMERASTLRGRRDAADGAFRQRLGSVDPAWSGERLIACDVSPAARAAMRIFESRWHEVAAEEEGARDALAVAAGPREALLEERVRAAAEVETGLGEARRIEEEREMLARLGANLDELGKEHALGEVMDRRVQEREVALRSTEAEVVPEPPAWLPPILWAIVPLAVVAMPWRALHADLAGAAAFALTAFIAALGAWGTSQLRRWRAAREQRREAEFRVLRAELYEARRMRDTHWRQAAERLETVARDAVRVGLPRLPKITQIEQREHDLARRANRTGRLAKLEARLVEIDTQIAGSERDLAVLEERMESARQAAAAWQREWASWKGEHFLPEDLAVEQGREQLDLIEQAQAAVRELAVAEAELGQLERETAAWEAAARELLGDDSARSGPESLVDGIVELHRKHVENQARRLAAQRLDREMEERGRRIAEARAEVERCEGERRRLLAEAGAADEAEVERRQALAARRRALEQTAAERAASLAARIDREHEPKAIWETLSAADPSAWERGAREADEGVRDTEQRLLEAAARHRDAERRRQELEESDEIARLELQRNGLIDELGAAVRRWRVLAVARGLMEETLEEFRANRQPPVLAAASHSFALVTDGRYRRIEQDESGRELVALEVEGGRKRVPDGLSRGTAEQLYLCLRLGLIVDFARRGTSLPVVMDDVLVNFDPGRAGAMAVALGDFARGRQVLFFTCHPHVCSMLEQLGRASAVIQL